MKKNIELVKQESAKLYQEIIDNGYSKELAKTISDELADKGGYLFNKSHACSYAVICLQTAYLKAHYPTYFFKALFNLNKDKAGMVNKYILDAKQFGIEVAPPQINNSMIDFSISGSKILFGLSAIKGIGETFAKEIIANRGTGFISINDFKDKINPSKAQVISLIKAGAIPTKNKRKLLIKYLLSLYEPLKFTPVKSLPTYKDLQNTWGINIEKYRIGDKKYDYDKEKLLIDYNSKKKLIFEDEQEKRLDSYKEKNEKYLKNEPFWEFEALQIFINENPFDKAYKYLDAFEDIEVGETCVIVGIIAKVQKKKDKSKKQFAFVNIYSSFGLVEGIVWHSQLKEYEDLIKTGQQLAWKVKKEGEDKVIVKEVKPYEQWVEERRMKGVSI